MGITSRAVTERAQGKAGRLMAGKTDFTPDESKALLKAVMAGLAVSRELFQEILG